MILIDRAVGIDLGTTNSEIAVLPPSEREIVVYQDRFGRRTVPSAVAWDAEKESFLVGRAARARRGKEPPPVESVKRSMGQDVRLAVGPHDLSPEAISSKILAGLAREMHQFLAEKASDGVSLLVKRAVITVPAYFDALQIEATRKAGEESGLSVLGILHEPTAAAIYHSFKRRISGGNFLVYDLGGGTFDVSVLRCMGGEYQVLAIDGDNFLGGDDFDRRYAEHLRKTLSARGYKLELDVRGSKQDRHRFERLVHIAQEIKEGLSSATTVNLSKQDVLEDQDGEPISIELEVGRSEYETTIRDLVERTIECAERALAESARSANVSLAEIDHVILVGGSTRVPLVQALVQERLASHTKGKEPLADEVDTIVALGAAVHAAQVGGVIISRDDCPVSVRLTSPLVSNKELVKLSGTVTSSAAPATAVAIHGGEKVELSEGAFRLELTPPLDGDSELLLSVFDAGGQELGALPFVLYRGDARPRASALSRASVIAKEIGVEIVKAGRRERRILLARGTGLPTETHHTFFTADQSGTVALRLMEGRMPLKTLALSIPRDLPVGKEVELWLKCDEAMRIEARALVAGQELWATVEAAPQPKFEGTAEIEELLREAEERRGNFWGHQGDAYRREIDLLTSSVREVMSTDPAKLSALCARLRRLLDDIAGEPGDPLEPPLATFEAELDALRRVVYRSEGTLIGLDRSAWEERLARIEEAASEARGAIDAVLWRRTFNEVQALYETAVQEEFAGRRLDDPAYLEMRVHSLSRWRTRVERTLLDFVPSTTDELRAPQERERTRLLGLLASKVDEPLARIERGDVPVAQDKRMLLDQMGAELERIETALDRLPALGLPTERGGGSGRA